VDDRDRSCAELWMMLRPVLADSLLVLGLM
jgi:hypothetical protein